MIYIGDTGKSQWSLSGPEFVFLIPFPSFLVPSCAWTSSQTKSTSSELVEITNVLSPFISLTDLCVSLLFVTPGRLCPHSPSPGPLSVSSTTLQGRGHPSHPLCLVNYLPLRPSTHSRRVSDEQRSSFSSSTPNNFCLILFLSTRDISSNSQSPTTVPYLLFDSTFRHTPRTTPVSCSVTGR